MALADTSFIHFSEKYFPTVMIEPGVNQSYK